MYITQQQEEFSRAYVYAIAAAAGLKYSAGAMPDDDSVDATISTRGPRGILRSPRVDLQIKCQRRPAAGDPIPYALPAKNYEDLRHADYATPRILVVVFVPAQVTEWVAHAEHELAVRHCGYWTSLRGHPPSSNEHTTTVYLPRAQPFSAAGLEMIMDRIGRGEPL